MTFNATYGLRECFNWEMSVKVTWLMKRCLAIWVVLACCGCLVSAQTGLEQPGQHSDLGFPRVWPQGPEHDSVPAWAAPGKIRFARWDGGRIEVAKAVLSGWPGFCPPDPDLVYTMANWYDPGTIRIAQAAGLNTLWITFSVGFANETESTHQQQVCQYIRECHRAGIRVMAYESLANIFWEDLFVVHPAAANWPCIGKDGKPVPYGAANFAKVGRITRYMADLTKPEWRDYLRGRVDLAIDAGADGITYDNNFGSCLAEVYHELQQHAASRKKDFLMMGNFHANTYVLNRLLNSLTTEDGLEPGCYANVSSNLCRRVTPLAGGSLANNIGLLRIHEALGAGWKPAMVECGLRETGDRLLNLMTPRHTQLALAESMAFGVAHELFVEGKVAHQLSSGDRAAWESWRAAGAYNRFFAEHEALYLGARSQADIAVVLDDGAANVALLDGLAAHGVLFNVLYEGDLNSALLQRYKAALVVAGSVRAGARVALEEFAAHGGGLIRPSANISAAALAVELKRACGEPLATLAVPEGVLFNVAVQAQRKRLVVHLLNYTDHPVEKIKLTVQGRYKKCTLFSPDVQMQTRCGSVVVDQKTTVEIPALDIYSVLTLE